jgi:hypothetical protein
VDLPNPPTRKFSLEHPELETERMSSVKFPDLITRDSAAAYFELNPWAASEDEKMAFNAKVGVDEEAG